MEHMAAAVFGISTLHPFQKTVIELAKQSGSRVLVHAGTGSGKSLCYQLAVLLSDGIGLVVSPLVSIMRDQVNALKLRNVKAIAVERDTPDESFREIRNGTYQLIYASPEMLVGGRLSDVLRLPLFQQRLRLVAIDECHLVTKWSVSVRFV
jgi:ATP-dependent DNA helicase RecQ